MAAAHRRMLSLIAEIDRRRVWRDLGARDTAHWLSIRYGVSQWKARRWIDAAHALESLPAVSEALESGELHLDKVAELTRFATPETESRCWCGRAACPAGRSGVRRTSRSAGRSRTSRASSGAARSLGERSTTGGASASRVSFRPRTGRRRGQGARRPGKHRAGHAGRGGTSRHRREARGRPRGAVLGPDRRRTRAGPNDGDRARPPRGVGPAGRVRGRGRSGDQLRVRRAARVQRAGPGPAGERERGPGAGRPDEPRASDVDGSSAEVP